jgi:hypothetical protein
LFRSNIGGDTTTFSIQGALNRVADRGSGRIDFIFARRRTLL